MPTTPREPLFSDLHQRHGQPGYLLLHHKSARRRGCSSLTAPEKRRLRIAMIPMVKSCGQTEPWQRSTRCSIGGYYYESETGFYYLQSRYYNPVICRFINADSFVSTGQSFSGYNMFAYCNNNPVPNSDPTGDILISTLILIGSAIVGAACAGYTAYKEAEAGIDTVQIVGGFFVCGI